MKPANRHSFFNTTLGFKAVRAPNNPQETWLINQDSSLAAEEFQQWQIPARDAAYNAFMNKLAANELPIFTREELDPKNQAINAVIEYTLNLLDELTLNYLAQAIIDDEREIVKAMLDKKPELLLHGTFVVATSEHTGQQFSSDNFLGLACWRKQIEMVKIILPYFDKLIADKEDKEKIARISAIKNSGLKQWQEYQFDQHHRIDIPADYLDIIDELIALFTTETIPAGTTDFRTLTTNIETAMEKLYNRLVPDYKETEISARRVLTKQNHLDIELLLYAAYSYFEFHSYAMYSPYRNKSFKTLEQRSAYWIRVIGILQSCLPPQTAKMLCEGFYPVSIENRVISARAAQLQLKDGISFYSVSNFATRSGLGFEFVVAPLWMDGTYKKAPSETTDMLGASDTFERFCRSKNQDFRSILRAMVRDDNVDASTYIMFRRYF